MSIYIHESETYPGEVIKSIELLARTKENGPVSFQIKATGKEDIARLKALVKPLIDEDTVSQATMDLNPSDMFY